MKNKKITDLNPEELVNLMNELMDFCVNKMQNRSLGIYDKSSFHDLKKQSILLWNTYDNTYGYVTEKVNNIKDLENIKNDWLYLWNQFDYINQNKLYKLLKPQTRQELDIALGIETCSLN